MGNKKPKRFYKFTWSTRDFYVKSGERGKIKRMARPPRPRSKARRIMQNAGVWVTKDY